MTAATTLACLSVRLHSLCISFPPQRNKADGRPPVSRSARGFLPLGNFFLSVASHWHWRDQSVFIPKTTLSVLLLEEEEDIFMLFESIM